MKLKVKIEIELIALNDMIYGFTPTNLSVKWIVMFSVALRCVVLQASLVGWVGRLPLRTAQATMPKCNVAASCYHLPGYRED